MRAEWAAEQFRLLGRSDAQELGVALVAAVQGIILMANAMHDPQVLVRQVARVRQWVAQAVSRAAPREPARGSAIRESTST